MSHALSFAGVSGADQGARQQLRAAQRLCRQRRRVRVAWAAHGWIDAERRPRAVGACGGFHTLLRAKCGSFARARHMRPARAPPQQVRAHE
eukprot:2807434-Pleurochrysis_carterae.AAC.3